MSESALAVNLEHFDGHYETEKQDGVEETLITMYRLATKKHHKTAMFCDVFIKFEVVNVVRTLALTCLFTF